MSNRDRGVSARTGAVSWRQQAATLARLTVPLVLSTGCFAITLFTDRLMLMYYRPVASAASTSAGTLYWTFACLPVIAIGYASTLVAQHHGRKQRRLIGPTVWQTVWLTLATLPFFVAVAAIAGHLFEALGHAPELVSNEVTYFRMLLCAVPASMLEGGLTSFFTGRSRAMPILLANLLCTALNVPLNYLLIFGPGSLPELGTFGASLSTVLCVWVKVAVFVWAPSRYGRLERFGLERWRPDWQLMKPLVRRGFPLGSQQLIRSAFMSAFFGLLGAAGVQALSASGIVMSLNQLVLIPLIGLSTAATVLIAQWQDTDTAAAKRVALLAGVPAPGLTAAAGIVYCLAPETLGDLLRGDAVENATLGSAVTFVLMVSAPLLVLETTCQLGMAFLRGLTRTGAMLRATVISTACVVPVAAAVFLAGRSSLGTMWLLYLSWTGIQAVLLGFEFATAWWPSATRRLTGRLRSLVGRAAYPASEPYSPLPAGPIAAAVTSVAVTTAAAASAAAKAVDAVTLSS